MCVAVSEATRCTREGGSSAGVGRVPLCICEISVTEELVIGSGCFQESVYTLLPVPVDTHRSGAVGLWVPVSVNWAVGIHVRGSIWEPCVTPPSAALCPQAVEECVSGQHCVCLPRSPAGAPSLTSRAGRQRNQGAICEGTRCLSVGGGDELIRLICQSQRHAE